MNKKISLYSIILILLITNASGIILKYFELDTYIILVGFRFQLSLCLPFLITFRSDQISLIKKTLTNPGTNKHIIFIYLIAVPIILLTVVSLLLNKIKLGDPEYAYEFGFSSIVDFPIYLTWNSIQLLFLFQFLILTSSFFKNKFLSSFLTIIFIFAYIIVPIKTEINYFHAVSLALFASILGIMVKYLQNIYWLIAFTFSVFWLHILLFGSKSDTLIHLLFASQYNSWDGFFFPAKQYENFLLPVNLIIIILVLVFYINSLKKVR